MNNVLKTPLVWEMTEKHVYHAKVATELEKHPENAQQHLIQGCLSVDPDLIHIALSFGADLRIIGSSGKAPIELLASSEKLKRQQKGAGKHKKG